jgi:hypothetical protein
VVLARQKVVVLSSLKVRMQEARAPVVCFSFKQDKQLLGRQVQLI